ncbi:MAG TPA: divalent-cation tolerance protein CutA [Candidatus Nanopusillus sp.]|nr:divalent-cation tolerance protein CutA [Candidatus Nanopusillus sp.]HIP90158.1 divalent-cation tolerance protein CutA [Candidatus Nanopusillus sp.]
MIIVLVTAPKGKGEELSKRVLEKRLATYVSISTIKSMYWKENNTIYEEEDLLIIKTRKAIFDNLSDFIKKIYLYKIPKIVAINIIDANVEYLSWVESETSLKKI